MTTENKKALHSFNRRNKTHTHPNIKQPSKETKGLVLVSVHSNQHLVTWCEANLPNTSHHPKSNLQEVSTIAKLKAYMEEHNLKEYPD